MILLNMILKDGGSNNRMWIPPFAACFVGSMAMMMFQFLSAVYLDIINTLFMCFAIDKDNNIVNPDDEFTSIVMEVPKYYMDASAASVTDGEKEADIPVAEAVHAPLRKKR